MSVKGRVVKRQTATFPVPYVALQLDGSSVINDKLGGGAAGGVGPTGLGGGAAVANLVDVRMSGAWAARCAGIEEGDDLQITGFDVSRAADYEGASHALALGHAPPSAAVSVSHYHQSNADAPLVSLGLDDDDDDDGYDDPRRHNLHASGNYGGGSRGYHTAAGSSGKATTSDGAAYGACPFVIEPNSTTVITVSKRVALTITAATNAAASSGLDGPSAQSPANAAAPTGRGALGVAGNADAGGGAINTYAQLHRYYDVVYAQKADFAAHASLIERLIGSRRGAVLDVGCGTGTLAHHLAVQGFPVVAIDASPAMAGVMAEKGETFASASAGAAGVKFVQTAIDSRAFSLVGVGEGGQDIVRDFSTVLCIDVLSQLPSLAAIRQAFANITLHASRGCLLVLSVLNLDHWGPRIGTVAQSADHFDCGRASLAVTAASVPAGTVDVVSRTYVAAPSNGDEGAEITTEITALALHPRAERPTLTLLERTVERAVSPAFVESLAEGLGWRVRDVFASASGDPVAVDGSVPAAPKRVYVFQRTDTAVS